MTDRTARNIITRAGALAKLSLPVHPHMLRHATGYYLASKGHKTRGPFKLTWDTSVERQLHRPNDN